MKNTRPNGQSGPVPKKIHYCWFGGKPLPKSAIRCIDSWRRFMPGYEIVRWDESNFDVDAIPFTSQAYKCGKYAFVSDYARFKILYEEGGLYFDTDVELVKSLHDIVGKGGFMGCEGQFREGGEVRDLNINPGVGMASAPGSPLLKEMLEIYENTSFLMPDGSRNKQTVVLYMTELLAKKGLRHTPEIQQVEDFWIYPVDYFCPISTVDGKLRLTGNTRSIHYYDQSWQSPVRKYGRKFLLKVGGHRLKDWLKPLLIKEK